MVITVTYLKEWVDVGTKVIESFLNFFLNCKNYKKGLCQLTSSTDVMTFWDIYCTYSYIRGIFF
jgi:hypothetical protein